MNSKITIEDYFNDRVTDKQVIDYIEQKLIEQGCQSSGFTRLNGPRTCKYRGENNAKCAVGHLISDDQYRNTMENKSFNESFLELYYPALKVNSDKIFFLRKLQQAHDSSSIGLYDRSFGYNIKVSFSNIRKQHNLT